MVLRSALAAGIEVLVSLFYSDVYPFRDAHRPRIPGRSAPVRNG